MDHLAIARALQAGLLLWLGALGLLLFYRLLTRQIFGRGLLAHARGAGGFEPERMQALGVFLFALGGYALHALQVLHDAPAGTPLAMPDVPQSLLILFAGSHTIYLSGKLSRTLRN